MKIKFHKYQATGNDFILLNGFGDGVNLTLDQIRLLCDRHFGIGSDGLIILRPDTETDFFMEFYNPDGSIATFCGNGGRAIVLFAYMQGLVEAKTVFRALDGKHEAETISQNKVKLGMKNVETIRETKHGLYLNTGTHHIVLFEKDVDSIDINAIAPPIRYDPDFAPDGTNVNFVQLLDRNSIKVRTYEKGVEAETLSCGTGVVASAIAAAEKYLLQPPITVFTCGGELTVNFEKQNNTYKKITLTGNVELVFWGYIEV